MPYEYEIYHIGPGTTQTHHKTMKQYTKPTKSWEHGVKPLKNGMDWRLLWLQQQQYFQHRLYRATKKVKILSKTFFSNRKLTICRLWITKSSAAADAAIMMVLVILGRSEARKVNFLGECRVQRWNLFFGVHVWIERTRLVLVSDRVRRSSQNLWQVDIIRRRRQGFRQLVAQRVNKPRTFRRTPPREVSYRERISHKVINQLITLRAS